MASFSAQVLTCIISARKLQLFPLKVTAGFHRRGGDLSPTHFLFVNRIQRWILSQPQTVKASISIPGKKKQIDTSRTTEEKGQEVHLFNIYTFSDISDCRGIETMILVSKRETERMKDRQADRRREDTKKEREKRLQTGENQPPSSLWTSLPAVYLLLFTQRIRLFRSTSDTRFSLFQGESLWFLWCSERHVCIEISK